MRPNYHNVRKLDEWLWHGDPKATEKAISTQNKVIFYGHRPNFARMKYLCEINALSLGVSKNYQWALYFNMLSALCLIRYNHLQLRGLLLGGKEVKVKVQFSSKASISCFIANRHLGWERTLEYWVSSISTIIEAKKCRCEGKNLVIIHKVCYRIEGHTREVRRSIGSGRRMGCPHNIAIIIL